MVNGIHTGHVGQQDLRRTDVGVGLFSADVLLARLQGHAQRASASGINGDTDDTARYLALMFVLAGEEGGMRSAESHGDAEALRGAQGNVRSHAAWRLEQDQRHGVGGDGDYGLAVVQGADDIGQVDAFAAVVGILQQCAEHFMSRCLVSLAEYQFVAEEARPGLHDIDGLRETVLVDEELVCSRPGDTSRHGHGFGGRGCFVEQRGVCQRQSGQIDDHLLEIQQGFQASLGNLRLIRRVGGVPAGVLQDVAQDDVRQQRFVVAHADQRLVHAVAASDPLQLRQCQVLAHRPGQIQRRRQAYRCRNRLVDQRVETRSSNRGEHCSQFVAFMAKMSGDELIALFKRLQSRGGCHGAGSVFVGDRSVASGIEQGR